MQQIVKSHRKVHGFDSYSQAHQDLFVRLLLNFKRNGVYVEIGASDPKESNNTYLLETEFDWSGFSLEIDADLTDSFNLVRKNKCICADATDFDYRNYFDANKYPFNIDYLSLDIDPAPMTFAALKTLPFSDYRFSVITYEHDCYTNGPEFMLKSREFLEGQGYVRVVSNVLCRGRDFEDWYIDPTCVSVDRYRKFISNNIECVNIFDPIGAFK
jgi:hypothetical protein